MITGLAGGIHISLFYPVFSGSMRTGKKISAWLENRWANEASICEDLSVRTEDLGRRKHKQHELGV